MKKKILLFLSMLVLLLVCGTIESFAYDWSFDLSAPTEDVGRGESLTFDYVVRNNETIYWLDMMSFVVDPWQNGEAQSLFDYPLISPGEEVTANLYRFTWAVDAPIGFINNGDFTIGGDWYDNDPGSGGSYISTESLSESYSTTCVPEPSSCILFCAGIVGLLTVCSKRKKRKHQDKVKRKPHLFF